MLEMYCMIGDLNEGVGLSLRDCSRHRDTFISAGGVSSAIRTNYYTCYFCRLTTMSVIHVPIDSMQPANGQSMNRIFRRPQVGPWKTQKCT